VEEHADAKQVALGLSDVHRQGIVVDSDPERLLDTLSTIDLPYAPKWIRRDET